MSYRKPELSRVLWDETCTGSGRPLLKIRAEDGKVDTLVTFDNHTGGYWKSMSEHNEKNGRQNGYGHHSGKRRKNRRRGRLFARLILLLALVFILVCILILGRKLALKNHSAGEPPKGAASVTAQSLQETSSGPETAAVSAPDRQADLQDVPAPSSKEEALNGASAAAKQYDYDRAIAILQKFDGAGTDDDMQTAIRDYTTQKEACKPVDVTQVPHIFFHSLLNDDRGLRKDVVGEDRAWRNDAAMTTADEFDHMIQDMYDAGYVMVSLDDLCVKTKNADGSVSISKNPNLMLPEGKKAFVLSEDDLSYYHTYGIGTQGYATKMLIDKNGEVKCEYTDENGETKIGDYDVVPRMDTFVKNHPDFSYHGHKGTVAMTGYDGVFGYRTNDYYKDINNEKLSQDQVEWLKDHPDFNWEQDVKDATAVANAMKATGWTFASHTYAHWNATDKTAEQLQQDNERWMTVNHPILGDVDKIIFAFGGDIGGVGDYTEENAKYKYFKSQGYNIFCNVDGNIGWTQFGEGYMRTGRVALDGFTMYQSFTPEGKSHATYAHDYEVLGIKDVASFFNKNRITPIEGE